MENEMDFGESDEILGAVIIGGTAIGMFIAGWVTNKIFANKALKAEIVDIRRQLMALPATHVAVMPPATATVQL